MNAEPTRPSPSNSTEVSDPVSLPSFFTSSSSSLKPLRERNRTNLKRRANISRSQVLSEDFENENSLSNTNIIQKVTTTSTTTSSQPLLTPNIRSHSEIYSKTDSPKTPSPIHTTVTCSQVWERLASNEEHQSTTSPKPTITPTTSTSSLPRHISFSFDPSDNEDEGEEDLVKDEKDDFQYVPISSQSKLVQFQFLSFARQQNLDFNSDNEEKHNTIVSQNLEDSDEDDIEQQEEQCQDEDEQQEQEVGLHENRRSKKRKRSISAANSLDDVPATVETANNDTNTASSVAKPPRTKKPKTKDPNANFQRLNMRKKSFSHTKKHQFAKHKRNAFYRRMRYAGGNK